MSVKRPAAIGPASPRWVTAAVALLLAIAARPDGAGSAPRDGNDQSATQTFLAEIHSLATTSLKADRYAIPGRDGWLFFTPVLRSVSAGPFWGQHAAKTPDADPLPAIVDFHRQLKHAGIELLVVPVPASATIYPEAISTTFNLPRDGKLPRLDIHHQQFYRILGEQGVPVLDLWPLFVAQRADPRGPSPLYCRTDTHWSGRACVLVAETVAAKLKDRDWLKAEPREMLASETREVQITGDLAQLIDKDDPQRERLTLTFVGHETPNGLEPVKPRRDSPVLLMGDSHTLVFHVPSLHAHGAGLADHLAKQLGFPVDLIGTRGSGSTATRYTLARRKDNLAGKKFVIWCFSIREFTDSSNGWPKVPVIRPAK